MRPGCAPASPSLWTSRLEDRRPSRHLIISSTTMLSPTIVCERPPPSLRALVTATPSHVSDLYCHAHHCYSATQLPGRGLLKLATYLPSPPASPPFLPSASPFSAHPSNLARLACPSPSLIARASRVHKTPYHTLAKPQYTLFKMSQSPYATWPSGVKTEHDQFPGNPQASMTASRRSGSADNQQAASFAYGSYPQVWNEVQSFVAGVVCSPVLVISTAWRGAASSSVALRDARPLKLHLEPLWCDGRRAHRRPTSPVRHSSLRSRILDIVSDIQHDVWHAVHKRA